MSIKTQMSEDKKTLTIDIIGNFDITAYHDFGDSYKDLSGNDVKVFINMAETKYIDSSALGMLLMLRERAGGDDAEVDIINASDGIKKILATANFDKLFNMV
uniref:Anti-anti-sigma regulatory factor n=1 Tax=Candidatus Magnetananas rongchengensis TaxID=1463558 RepID=A0A3S6IW35_9BACT|nr:anti-anti-sigma regulatory factor [Candidatus Magnetananas rongchenensis]